jgi:hypothetical protein
MAIAATVISLSFPSPAYALGEVYDATGYKPVTL